MNARRCLAPVLLVTLLAQVLGKGAKVRVRKKNMKDRADGRSSTSSSSSSVSAAETLEYLTRYSFRNASDEERLLAYLFRDYDPVARGVMDTDKPVKVKVDFVLLRIHGLDERSQVLTTTGLVITEWLDERLTWEPEKFGNLTDIILKADKLWLPELAVMNGADELIPDFERIRVLLSHDGMLHWEPGGIFRTTCDIDITYFPFDTQHCPMLIGAYSYYIDKMNISNTADEIMIHDFRLNGEWHVHATSAVWNVTVLDCCPGKGYPHVVFTLHLTRRFKFYIMNIVLPCLMLSVLIMIGFFLPPDAGEKISLGISVLLAFTVFLLMVADNIPRTSLAIPLMVIYLTATMTLGTISICLTVLVLNIHHRGPERPVPACLKVLVLYYVARILFVRTTYRRQHRPRPRRQGPDLMPSYAKCNTLKFIVDGNGVVDELEMLNLTAKMNSRSTANGPRSLGLPEGRRDGAAGGGTPLKDSTKQDGRRRDSEDIEMEEDTGKEWREFACVMDRFFFWLLFISMTACAVFILLFPKYTGIEKELLEGPSPH